MSDFNVFATAVNARFQSMSSGELYTVDACDLSKALGVSPMDIIGPLIGEPSEAGELAKQVASLKQQLTAVRTAVREATK